MMVYKHENCVINIAKNFIVKESCGMDIWWGARKSMWLEEWWMWKYKEEVVDLRKDGLTV
jgi:hypothetical protein